MLFFHLNHGKRSIVLEPASRHATLLQMLPGTDIVIAPPGLDRTGFAEANPDCIVAVVSPFGETGEWSNWRGCELIYQALSSVMLHNGEPGRAPLYGCGHRASFAAGTALYIGILSAVLAEGPGQDVDVSIAETAASMTTASTGFAYSGAQEVRNAGEHQLRCRDGWIGVWIYSHLWPGFCAATGLQDLQDDPRFAAADDRQRNWLELMRVAQAAVGDQAADDVVARLQSHRVIAAKAAGLIELTGTHPHLAARGFWEQVQTPEGRRTVLGPPFRMSASPRALRGGAPRLGGR